MSRVSTRQIDPSSVGTFDTPFGILPQSRSFPNRGSNNLETVRQALLGTAETATRMVGLSERAKEALREARYNEYSVQLAEAERRAVETEDYTEVDTLARTFATDTTLGDDQRARLFGQSTRAAQIQKQIEEQARAKAERDTIRAGLGFLNSTGTKISESLSNDVEFQKHLGTLSPEEAEAAVIEEIQARIPEESGYTVDYFLNDDNYKAAATDLILKALRPSYGYRNQAIAQAKLTTDQYQEQGVFAAFRGGMSVELALRNIDDIYSEATPDERLQARYQFAARILRAGYNTRDVNAAKTELNRHQQLVQAFQGTPYEGEMERLYAETGQEFGRLALQDLQRAMPRLKTKDQFDGYVRDLIRKYGDIEAPGVDLATVVADDKWGANFLSQVQSFYEEHVRRTFPQGREQAIPPRYVDGVLGLNPQDGDRRFEASPLNILLQTDRNGQHVEDTKMFIRGLEGVPADVKAGLISALDSGTPILPDNPLFLAAAPHLAQAQVAAELANNPIGNVGRRYGELYTQTTPQALAMTQGITTALIDRFGDPSSHEFQAAAAEFTGGDPLATAILTNDAAVTLPNGGVDLKQRRQDLIDAWNRTNKAKAGWADDPKLSTFSKEIQEVYGLKPDAIMSDSMRTRLSGIIADAAAESGGDMKLARQLVVRDMRAERAFVKVNTEVTGAGEVKSFYIDRFSRLPESHKERRKLVDSLLYSEHPDVYESLSSQLRVGHFRLDDNFYFPNIQRPILDAVDRAAVSLEEAPGALVGGILKELRKSDESRKTGDTDGRRTVGDVLYEYLTNPEYHNGKPPINDTKGTKQAFFNGDLVDIQFIAGPELNDPDGGVGVRIVFKEAMGDNRPSPLDLMTPEGHPVVVDTRPLALSRFDVSNLVRDRGPLYGAVSTPGAAPTITILDRLKND